MHCYRIVDKLQGREGEGLMGLGWGFAKHKLVFFEFHNRPWSAWDGPGWLWLWSSGAVLWRLQSSVLAYLIYSKLVRIWGSCTSSSHLCHRFASLFCCYDFCTSELQSLVFYFLGRGVECLEFRDDSQDSQNDTRVRGNYVFCTFSSSRKVNIVVSLSSAFL